MIKDITVLISATSHKVIANIYNHISTIIPVHQVAMALCLLR